MVTQEMITNGFIDAFSTITLHYALVLLCGFIGMWILYGIGLLFYKLYWALRNFYWYHYVSEEKRHAHFHAKEEKRRMKKKKENEKFLRNIGLGKYLDDEKK